MNLIFRYLEMISRYQEMISRYPEINRITDFPGNREIRQRHRTTPSIILWKAIWVFIQHFPISGIISRYREFEFPISGNQFPISGNNQFPDIGKWFSDIGNWFSDIGKCVWFPDIGKSIPDIQKSPPYRSRSLRHPATPPYHAPYQQRPPAIPAPSETVITTSVNHSVYTYIYAKLDQCNQQ